LTTQFLASSSLTAVFTWANTNPLIRHAGRSTVNTDDVLLLARRNEGLGELLKAFVDEENAGKLADKGKGKGKGVGKK